MALVVRRFCEISKFFLFSAVNGATASTSFSSDSSRSFSDPGRIKKREVGVGEAWTNERKKREVSERGNDDVIL